MDLERKAIIYLAKGLLQKNDDNKMKKEESKGDEYIVGPYLRQRIENL